MATKEKQTTQTKPVNVKVIQDDGAPVGAEILAKAIIEIDTAMRQILNAGLKKSTIITLVSASSGVGKRDTEFVINHLSNLRATYCNK